MCRGGPGEKTKEQSQEVGVTVTRCLGVSGLEGNVGGIRPSEAAGRGSGARERGEPRDRCVRDGQRGGQPGTGGWDRSGGGQVQEIHGESKGAMLSRLVPPGPSPCSVPPASVGSSGGQ